jgi:hypothetical protein
MPRSKPPPLSDLKQALRWRLRIEARPYPIRSSILTVTVSPASFPMAFRTSAFTGSMCLPSPMAINELRNGWPLIVARTFTRPRVPKNLTDSGHNMYVHAPLLWPFSRVAVNRLFNFIALPTPLSANKGTGSHRYTLTPVRAAGTVRVTEKPRPRQRKNYRTWGGSE